MLKRDQGVVVDAGGTNSRVVVVTACCASLLFAAERAVAAMQISAGVRLIRMVLPRRSKSSKNIVLMKTAKTASKKTTASYSGGCSGQGDLLVARKDSPVTSIPFALRINPLNQRLLVASIPFDVRINPLIRLLLVVRNLFGVRINPLFRPIMLVVRKLFDLKINLPNKSLFVARRLFVAKSTLLAIKLLVSRNSSWSITPRSHAVADFLIINNDPVAKKALPVRSLLVGKKFVFGIRGQVQMI